MYLATLPIFLIAGLFFWLVPLAVYLLAAIGFSVGSKKPLNEMVIIPAVYFTLHVAYGSGFIAGLSLKPANKQSHEEKQLIISN
jgi:hypothetical protein